jgi:hypothetical protein
MRRLLLILLALCAAVFVAKTVGKDVKRYKELSEM